MQLAEQINKKWAPINTADILNINLNKINFNGSLTVSMLDSIFPKFILSCELPSRPATNISTNTLSASEPLFLFE